MTDRFTTGQIVKLKNGSTAAVQFVGQTGFAPGDWLGVAFAEPVGKNDGSVKGETYFECEPQHGMFIRPEMAELVQEESELKTQAAASNNKPAASASKGKPSTMANGTRRTSSLDPAASKRQGMNSFSPTPGARDKPVMNGRLSPQKPPARHIASNSVSGPASTRGVTSSGPIRSVQPRPSAARSRPSISSSGAPQPSAAITRQSRPSLAAARGGRTTATPHSPRVSITVNQRSSKPLKESTPNGIYTARRETSQDPSIEDVLDRDETLRAEADDGDRGGSDNERTTVEGANGHIGPTSPPGAMMEPGSAKPSLKAAARPGTSTREIEELQTRLRMHEKQRDEDRDKLKTLERLQTERDRFESIIQKLQAKLHPQQQELADLRKQIKDLEARLEELEATQAEHDSLMEMTTLDREMAEEQADALRTELDAFKQKAEELELEAEVLREENQELSREMSPEERSSQGWLQLERESQRYRDALVRLRDVTQDKEAELTQEVASLQEDLKHLNGIQDQYSETKEKLRQSEAAVEDLRQQLDTALGAEEMLEELTEKNLTLTEQVDELKLNIEDLENLRELNDELELNHVEAEKQMQDELDYKDSLLGDQSHRSAQQDGKIADYEFTISKFRELVTNLQGHLEDMKASQQITEAEAEELNSRSKAMADLNLKLHSSAAKTQINTVELELKRLEAEEAIEHLAIVQMFLPETFNSERDSVLAYLRFRRIAAKCRVLHGTLKSKVSGEVSSRPSEDVFAICDVLDKLVWISVMCDRFVSSIGTCGLEQFAKYEAALYELEPVERAMNNYIEALKRNDLKERNVAEELRRSKALLTHLAEVHITTNSVEDYAEDVLMRTSLMQSYLENTATAMSFTRALISGPDREESTDDGLRDELDSKVDTFISQSRSAKVVAGKAIQSLHELKARSMSINPESSQVFEECQDLSAELATLIRQLGDHLRNSQNQETGEDTTPSTALQTHLGDFCTHHLPNTTYTEPFSILQQKLRTVSSQLSHILDLTASLKNTVEFERSPPPWHLRSEELKKANTTHISTEEELKRLKHDIHERVTQLRLRDQTLEEQAVKIELLESRTRDANAKANRITELQRAVEAGRSRERELAGTMEAQMREAYSLQSERDRWKRLADERQAADNLGQRNGGERGERTIATAREMESLRLEINGLQGAVRFLRDDNRRVRLGHPDESHMAWLWEPLIRRPSDEPGYGRREELKREGTDVLDRLLDVVTDARFVDLTHLPENKLAWRPAKEKGAWLCRSQRETWAAWTARLHAFCDKSVQELRTADPARVREDAGPATHNATGDHDAVPDQCDGAANSTAKQPRPSAFDSGVAGLEDDDFHEALSRQDEPRSQGSRIDFASVAAPFIPRI